MVLETGVLQFGFKKNSSTVICTSMLKELIIIMTIILIAMYFCWMPRRPSRELNIINYSINCVTGICV